jgi:hypothetical protein
MTTTKRLPWVTIFVAVSGCYQGIATDGPARPSTGGATTSELAGSTTSSGSTAVSGDPNAYAVTGPLVHPEYVSISRYHGGSTSAAVSPVIGPLASDLICSGIMVSPRVVLTTASCVAGADTFLVTTPYTPYYPGTPSHVDNMPGPVHDAFDGDIDGVVATEVHVYAGSPQQDLAALVLPEPIWNDPDHPVTYPTLGDAIAAGASVQLLGRVGGLTEGVCTCKVPRGQQSPQYCATYCAETATNCSPEDLTVPDNDGYTGFDDFGFGGVAPARRFHMSEPVSVLSAGADYQLPISDGQVSSIMVLSHERTIETEGTCFTSTANATVRDVAYSDIGGGLFLAGTDTLVGIASTNDGQTVHVARTDVAKAWIQQFIAAAGPLGASRLTNLSTRLLVEDGAKVGIAGFIIKGSGQKRVVLRAMGPSLGAFGISGPLADPNLEVHDGTGAMIASNDNWKTDPDAATLSGLSLAPSDDREAALVLNLAPGAYTAIVRGAGGASGVALVEVYDQDTAPAPTSQLVNLSTRGEVGTGEQVMIGGFIVSGPVAKRIVIRGLPGAANWSYLQIGCSPGDLLSTVTMELHDASGQLILRSRPAARQVCRRAVTSRARTLRAAPCPTSRAPICLAGCARAAFAKAGLSAAARSAATPASGATTSPVGVEPQALPVRSDRRARPGAQSCRGRTAAASSAAAPARHAPFRIVARVA